MQNVAYKRVSTVLQNTERQLDGLEFCRVFEDKVSGSNRKRPQLEAMISHVREGDTVHVHSIDRLARNLADLLELIETLTGKGVSIKFHKECMTFNGDNSDAMQRMQMQMMGAVAEFERAMINERANEGRKLAQAKGVKFGRKPTLTKKQVAALKELHANGKSVSKLAIDFDVSRPAIYRALKTA